MGKMKDVYIENISIKIKTYIKEEKYLIAGDYFMDICHYGIEIGNEMLVFISSELSDIYRNSLMGFKEYSDESDVTFVEELKSRTYKLIEFISDMPEKLNSEKLIEIFEMLKFIIYHGERLQYFWRKKERTRYIRKRRLSDLG